ncbi:MAG: hypothetical protein U7123_07305 [Potamolinea sp.]
MDAAIKTPANTAINIPDLTGNTMSDNAAINLLLAFLDKTNNTLRSLPADVMPKNFTLIQSPPQGVSAGVVRVTYTLQFDVALNLASAKVS